MDENNELATLTADIVAAYVSNNPLPAASIGGVIQEVHSALSRLSGEGAEAVADKKLVPAVSVRKSLSDDALTCLECGKSFKSLKRHIRTYHELTPDEYRARWKLPSDYPMVAPNYSETRAKMAKRIGLGRKPAD